MLGVLGLPTFHGVGILLLAHTSIYFLYYICVWRNKYIFFLIIIIILILSNRLSSHLNISSKMLRAMLVPNYMIVWIVTENRACFCFCNYSHSLNVFLNVSRKFSHVFLFHLGYCLLVVLYARHILKYSYCIIQKVIIVIER